jgi:hypothetical protein
MVIPAFPVSIRNPSSGSTWITGKSFDEGLDLENQIQI